MSDTPTPEITPQQAAASTEVLGSVFLIFDKAELQQQREGSKPYEFKGMHLLEESTFTVTYISNPGLGLTRYDLAFLISRGGGADIFGQSWADMLLITDNLKPLSWGIQFNWSNHQERVQATYPSFYDALEVVEAAFNQVQRQAEHTVSLASGLMLLNGIMQGLTKPNKPPSRAPAKRKSN